jgi:hypothetical protein
MSWCQAHSGTCDQMLLPVGMLLSCFCGAPSLTRGRVCNLQCNHTMVRVAQNPKPYFTVSSETPPSWRARLPYLYTPGTGWPSYAPGHWVPFKSSLTTRRANPPYIYNLQEQDGQVKSPSHVTKCICVCVCMKRGGLESSQPLHC